MKKRSKKQKEIDRSRYAEVYREGFEHGYQLGIRTEKMKGRGHDDNRVDKVDGQGTQTSTWRH
ncbi:hypothetical protein BpsM61_00042 [Bacillus phage vB_BpsM-61]|nr:hypothetical protein BpsM61_00042 [Bacillus phage vB_BpsM-61]